MELFNFILIIGLIVWLVNVNDKAERAEKKADFLFKSQNEKNKNKSDTASEEFNQNEIPKTATDLIEKENFDTPQVARQEFFETPTEPLATQIPEQKNVTTSKIEHPTKKSEVEETETAVNWLNRIGVVALVLGLGFFLKIAIDMGWIGHTGQIILGLLTGGLLVFLGELWKEKFGTRALALSGGGIAILYFVIYSAYDFFHLVPESLAFIATLIVSALAVFLTYRYESLTMGILAFFGAYSAPLLFNFNADEQILLVSYLSLINISSLLVLIKKFWSHLLFVTLFGTIIDFGIWCLNFNNIHNTMVSTSFILFTFLIFAIGSAALLRFHATKNPEDLKEKNSEDFISIFQIISGTFFFISIWSLLDLNYHNILPLISLLGATTVFLAYAFVSDLNFRWLNFCTSFVGMALLVSASVWKFDDKALSTALLAIALLGSYIGVLIKREDLRVWSLLVLFISLIKSLFDPYLVTDQTLIFNAKFGLMFANTLSLLFIGWLYSKIKTTEIEKVAEKFLQIIAALILWGTFSWDIACNFPGDQMQNFMTLWWIIYPTAIGAAAYMGKRESLFNVAGILLALSFLKVLFTPYEMSPVFLLNTKFGLTLLEVLAILFFAFLFKKDESQKDFRDVLYIIVSILMWFAVSWDIFAVFGKNDDWQNILTLWQLIYPVFLTWIADKFSNKRLLKVMLVLLFIGFIQTFFLNYTGTYQFLFNAKFGLMTLLTLILVGISYVLERDISFHKIATILKSTAIFLFWFAVSLEITKYFEHDAVQNACNLYLSLWWITYSAILIGIGIFWKKPLLRKIALGLFFLTIIKVFLYDLLSMDTSYAIVSLISLGVILLTVSFIYRKNKDEIVKFLDGPAE